MQSSSTRQLGHSSLEPYSRLLLVSSGRPTPTHTLTHTHTHTHTHTQRADYGYRADTYEQQRQRGPLPRKPPVTVHGAPPTRPGQRRQHPQRLPQSDRSANPITNSTSTKAVVANAGASAGHVAHAPHDSTAPQRRGARLENMVRCNKTSSPSIKARLGSWAKAPRLATAKTRLQVATWTEQAP